MFPTLRGYRRAWLAADVLAGLTLVAIALPEQMATARLANMPAVTGLYAFVAGSVLVAALGATGQLSVGADSTIAPVMAAGVGAVAVAGSARYTHAMVFLALVVGVMLVAAGVLHLGWIAEFIPGPVITGILAGIAIEIAVRQLPGLLGIHGHGTTTIGRLRDVAAHLGDTNGWAVAIAVGVLACIVVAEKLDRRVPGALIGLVVSTLVVAGADLPRHGVEILGKVHGGLPGLSTPSIASGEARRLVGTALTVAFLCIVQTAATVRALRRRAEPAVLFQRDLVAVGAGSVAAGFAGAFTVNGSPPRSAVVASSGGRSQAASVIAAAVVVVIVVAATGLLRDLPQATLAAILLFVASRLFRVRELTDVLRFDLTEFALAVVTLVVVAFVGIEQGVALAVLLALGDRIRRAARPGDAVLGREPGTDHWIPPDVGRPTEQVEGVVVYLLYGPLWFGNAEYVSERVRSLVASRPGTHTFVFDANGVPDLDYTGALAFGDLAEELRSQGVAIGVARASHLVHHDLKHAGLLETIGRDHLYPSVQSAVAALMRS